MTDRSVRSWRPRLVLLAPVLAALLVASSCGTGATSPATGGTTPPSASSSTSASASGADQPCVGDVAKVVARKTTDQMRTGRLPADLVATLDDAARKSFGEAAAPGAVVGVQTPQGTWTKAYGKADPKTGTPMTVGVHTRIGSITKTFTGTVLMRLAQDGRLSLDDPIAKYVSGVPNGNRITLRLLANMTSGVASYTASKKFTDLYFAEPETVFTPSQVLKVGLSESPMFEPGAEFFYSNTNTILLGFVIEKVTGQPVQEAFQRYIFGPLALTHTSWPGTSTKLPKPYAEGFTLQGNAATPDSPSNATHWNPSWTWTAGELVSTMDDLLVYGRALGTGVGLLDPSTQTERLTSFPPVRGYGLAVGCSSAWVGHSGELPGYNSTLFYDTTSDTTVVVQVNSDINSGDCEESPTLTDNTRDQVCSSPAVRMFVALSTALGNTFAAPPVR